jgi:hypothetical protein
VRRECPDQAASTGAQGTHGIQLFSGSRPSVRIDDARRPGPRGRPGASRHLPSGLAARAVPAGTVRVTVPSIVGGFVLGALPDRLPPYRLRVWQPTTQTRCSEPLHARRVQQPSLEPVRRTPAFQHVGVDSNPANLTPESTNRSAMKSSDRVIVDNVRVSALRRPSCPGCAHTVAVALPTSRPATQSTPRPSAASFRETHQLRRP